MSKKQFGWSLLTVLALAGCGAADTDDTELEAPLAVLASPGGEVPTLEEFVESTRQTRRIGDEAIEEHVLEGDMIVPYELVVDYYESMYVSPDTVRKGVGISIPNGRLQTFLKYNLNDFNPAITYCFDSTFSAGEKPAFVSAMASTTALWDAASGPLRFSYESAKDGASCNGSAASFRVTKAPGNVSQGSFPAGSNRFLSLVSATSTGNILHELGHIIGLAHEKNHTQTTLTCAAEQLPSSVPTGASFADLTVTFDAQSVMQNRGANGLLACLNASAGPTFLSAGDKVAARALYGN